MLVKNLATVDLKYQWKLQPGSKLEIDQLRGTFKPMETKTMQISLTAQDTIPTFESVALELLDIPPQSIRSRQTAGTSSLEYYQF